MSPAQSPPDRGSSSTLGNDPDQEATVDEPPGSARGTAGARPRGSVMRDVARLAGVSHQTVSRVLNEHPSVRQETRAKVLQAMRVLNYRRNAAARTLVTRRSGVLGILGYESTLYGPASMLYGIEDAARTAGYFISVASVRSLDRESVLEAIDRLCQQAVEGIVAIAPKQSVHTALAQIPSDLTCVAVGAASETTIPVIRIDNTAGAALATNHLLGLGHQTVHHLAGPADWPEAQERVEGWRETLYAAGRIVPRVHHLDWTARSGYQQGHALATDPSVTAVFCANDQIALGLLRALQEAGRRVPHDVSVVGFDDIPESEYFLPPLTTIRQDFADLGRRSIEVLIDRLRDGSGEPSGVVLTPDLVPRASTAPPAG